MTGCPAPRRRPPAGQVRLLAASRVLLATTLATELPYPVVTGPARDALTVGAVVAAAGAAASHAAASRGWRFAGRLVLATAGGGWLAEAVGVSTGRPFGRYRYGTGLGPRLAGVPALVPAAWLMIGYPCHALAGRAAGRPAGRVVAGAVAMVGWDVFLDPQMVAAGRWSWARPGRHLPGIPEVPLSNLLGWTAAALPVMAALEGARCDPPDPAQDAVPLALATWTYIGSLAANLLFFRRAAVALWGGVVMGLPIAAVLRRRRAG
jgi:uncharacterized membrane protein